MNLKIVMFMLISFSIANAGCGGCRDEGLGQRLGNEAIEKFKNLDEETSNKIGEIVKKINKAHQKIEVDSKNILIQNEKLLKMQAELNQNILWNLSIINKLQSTINSLESDGTK